MHLFLQACYITCGSSCLEWARDHVYKPEEEEEAPAPAKAAKGSKKTKAKGRESGGSAAKRART